MPFSSLSKVVSVNSAVFNVTWAPLTEKVVSPSCLRSGTGSFLEQAEIKKMK